MKLNANILFRCRSSRGSRVVFGDETLESPKVPRLLLDSTRQSTLRTPSMEIFPILMNRAPAAHASEDWSSYKAKDWTLLAISLVILILYEGFYLVIYYFLPHRCTLHRNIVSKSYVDLSHYSLEPKLS